jgi:hypothetical protein
MGNTVHLLERTAFSIQVFSIKYSVSEQQLLGRVMQTVQNLYLITPAAERAPRECARLAWQLFSNCMYASCQ